MYLIIGNLWNPIFVGLTSTDPNIGQFIVRSNPVNSKYLSQSKCYGTKNVAIFKERERERN